MIKTAQRAIRTAQTFFPGLSDLKADAQDRLSRLRRRPFEADFNALRLFGGEGRLHLDVGANRGQTLTAINICANRPRVVSFEPNPKLAGALLRRYAGVPDVRIEPFGLGDEAGEFTLHIPSYRGYVFDGLASTDRDSAASWLNEETLIGFDPSKLSIDTVRCQVRTMDSLGLDPFFVKIDVQGTELKVLKGGRQTIERSQPVLLIEWPEPAISAWLAERGYVAYAYDDRGTRFRRGQAGWLNTFFMTEEKAALVARHVTD